MFRGRNNLSIKDVDSAFDEFTQVEEQVVNDQELEQQEDEEVDHKMTSYSVVDEESGDKETISKNSFVISEDDGSTTTIDIMTIESDKNHAWLEEDREFQELLGEMRIAVGSMQLLEDQNNPNKIALVFDTDSGKTIIRAETTSDNLQENTSSLKDKIINIASNILSPIIISELYHDPTTRDMTLEELNDLKHRFPQTIKRHHDTLIFMQSIQP